jgi:pimeloyl-ACP methyl ester carboxylesterase
MNPRSTPPARAVLGFVAAATAAACASPPTPNSPVPAIEPHPCATWTELCEGEIRVPLDRADSTAGDLSIAFIWVPRADTTRPADGTILAIPGGPQEALPHLERYRRALGPVLDRRNMLMIDPRGLGRSGPLLCPDLVLDEAETVAACATALGRVDLFTAEQAAADMDAVREALGVPSVSLYGNSYGTVLAQAYAVRFPDRTDAIYLDSVVLIGEDGYVDYVAGDIRRVRTDLVELVCNRSPTCRVIPGTPTALLERLVEEARRDPDPIAPRHLAALVGTFAVNRVATRGLVAAMAAWLEGDPLPLDRMTDEFRGPDSFPPLAGPEWAGFLAYQCGDGRYPFDRAAPVAERRRQLAEYYQSSETLHPFDLHEMGGATGHDFWCVDWPTPRDTPPVPADASYPAVPVLALAGDFDSHSPAEVASMTRRMPEATLIPVRYGTHGLALHPAPVGRCARDIMRAFLSEPRHPPAPAVTDADCHAETFLALGSFPRTVATVPPARTDDLPASDRALVAAAFTTAADALVRRDPNHAFPVRPAVPGIRGGQIRYERGSRDVILEGTRFVEDLAVDGTLRFGDDDLVTAELVATGPDGRAHVLTLRWRAFVPGEMTQVEGTIDGRAFGAAVPLP